MERGLVQVYTGDGKGKTTAAFGQALRALGRGLKVVVIQFLKSNESGEVLYIRNNIPGMELHRFNSQEKFIRSMNNKELDQLKKETISGFEFAGKIIAGNKCDVLILDECLGAVNNGFITVPELINLIKSKPDTMEIVLTGRDASTELIEAADLVTEMKKIKHPFNEGIAARTGIEK